MSDPTWGFYGRETELAQLSEIFSRRRWFFAKIVGRRRIGKTTLIEKAIRNTKTQQPVFYAQIPDSAPMGVLTQIRDAISVFQIDENSFKPPTTLPELAKFIGMLARAGYVVVIDEFQYFNRDKLKDFCSFLQAEVDALSRDAASVPGGLVVLGSLHTELTAVLEDRSAPLYSRTTDELNLTHLDMASLLKLLMAHSDEVEPEHLLFLWSLFEGVPKFYRDCFEQGILSASRRELLKKAFFLSSSPLKTEADNWFLKELHGKYDFILQFVARNPGCTYGDISAYALTVKADTKDNQLGGYFTHLIERYGMIEKRLPVFSNHKKSRKGRYYLKDNFAAAWLAALKSAMSAINFRPVDELVRTADERLCDLEGKTLERLAMNLYEERSRKGVGDFLLTSKISGYWDKSDTELDLVALNEDEKRIRLGTCKRSAQKLVSDLTKFDGHITRFLNEFSEYKDWKVERVAIAPVIPPEMRPRLMLGGYIAQDLADLTRQLV